MNIFLDNVIFSLQRFGGITEYWRQICQLASFDKNIFQNKEESLHDKKLNIFCKKLLEYSTVVIPDEIDIFHSSYYRVPRSKFTNEVVTCHDFIYELLSPYLQKKLHMPLKFQALHRAKGIICISNSTKYDLLKLYPSVQRKNIEVIYHGVDHQMFYQMRNKQRDMQKVLFVGGRSGYKRFDVAVEAVSLSPNKYLAFSGVKPTASELRVLNSKIPSRWTYLGLITRTQLSEEYNSSFCLIFPSEKEGFGMPILEAMASGCPVIINEEAAMIEISGNASIIASNSDISTYKKAFVCLETNYLSYQQLSLDLAKKYSWDKCRECTLDFYQSLMN